ncbi:MAG: PAS domain-containing protein [Alphaproteobacteria bacterium]|nr:PAS domain-containing protein [Alphaproteobacteria bacterium]
MLDLLIRSSAKSWERALSEPTPRRAGSFTRRVLAALLLVSVLPMLVAVGVLHGRGRQLVEDLISENVRKTARAHAAELDAFLDSTRRAMQDMDPGDHEALRALAASDTRVLALLSVGQGGRLRAAGLPEAQLDPWALEACRALIERPTAPMIHAGEGMAHEVVVAVPDAEGVICAQVSFTLHQELISERARSYSEGRAYIVDREARVVCHAFEEDEPHIRRGAQLTTEAQAVAAEGEPWSGVVGQGEARAFAAFAPARALPWGVWVEVPASRAAAPLSTWLSQVLGLAAGLILVAGGLAALLVRRLVAPLGDMARAARGIAEGRYGDAVPVSGDDEVAELAQEFNQMSAALAESYARLDERVAQRTRELQAAREFSDLLLDTMQESILVMDRSLRVVRANPAALRLHGAGVLGAPCPSLDLEGEAPLVQQALRDGTPQRGERVRRGPSGPRLLEVEAYPVPGQGGEVEAVLEIARDVTDLRQAQARLLHQEKMVALGTLAAGLAHEIGNPLASLSSELQLLARAPEPEALQESMPVLQDQVRRMSGLLRELVELGQPPRDALLEHSPSELLQDAARLLRHDPRARDVSVLVEASANLPATRTSRDRVLQVLLNLGLNALDALAERGGGTLRFLAEQSPEGLRLIVEDDGPGIPEDQASRVFEPFYTTKAQGRGTGLGLFVSQQIAESLGGGIELGAAEGGGARVCLRLPYEREESDV